MFKIWYRFEKSHKHIEKVCGFSYKYMWIVPIQSFLLRREYLSSVVNELTKSLKTLHLTKGVFLKLSYFQSD